MSLFIVKGPHWVAGLVGTYYLSTEAAATTTTTTATTKTTTTTTTTTCKIWTLK